MYSNRKIILLGGSFDPIHYGHLEIMKTAMTQEQAQEGWFVLANQAPLKAGTDLDFEKRAEMVQMMIHHHRRLKLCTIEKEMSLPNYTIDTVTMLQKRYPEIEFVYVIGSDQAVRFTTWKDYQELLQRIKILVYPRHFNDDVDEKMFDRLKAPILEVSSTAIRQGKSVLTHPKILSTMITKGYYTLELIEQTLNPERVQHSINVAQLATSLAKVHGEDPSIAYSVGLIHDLFKHKSLAEMKPYLTPSEQQQPEYLHHGYALAHYLAKVYHIRDRAFLRAIYHHVLGQGTDRLSQILFIADKAEPGRPYETESYRTLAKQSLQVAVVRIIQDIEEIERKSQ